MIFVQFSVETGLLTEAIGHAPGTEVTLYSRHVSRDDGKLQSLIRVTGDSLNQFEDGLERDPTIKNYERLSDESHPRLYSIDLARPERSIEMYYRYHESGGRLVRATANGNQWLVEMEFPDRESLTTFWEWYQSNVTMPVLEQIQESQVDSRNRFRTLTSKQREAIRIAYENGYFKIPREVTTEQLANQLGISNQAYSQRLRRGLDNLIANSDVVSREE